MDKSNQVINEEIRGVDLDLEWVYLLLKAKKAGIKAEEIRQFFYERTLQVM
ncbi:MAG: anti-repressor SinI family protein [Paenibacillus sp.]|nr:anti-repressor SinI family protein [Paenibacillus sp.]